MRDKLFTSSLLAALCLSLSSIGMASTTWYVNGVSGSDSNNCLSTTTACKTIGHAISLAVSGDNILVAAATYSENLSIANSLKLIGSGASKTVIDGGGVGTVVTVPKGSNVTLSGLSITQGSALFGAGVSNNGRLTINKSIISGNRAHASCSKEKCGANVGGVGIYNLGGLTINQSTITSNSGSASCPYKYNGCGVYGAGINNGGRLAINNSTVSGNSGGTSCLFTYTACYPLGGGIYNSGTLVINKSTISGNDVNAGRCASCFARGGGIYQVGNSVMISNSTLSGNTAQGYMLPSGGGIYGGAVTISNSTISGNDATGSWNGANLGGNIYGALTMQNSIVANSSSGGNCSITVSSNGYNLSSDGTCGLSGPGDMNNTDPMLGPLQNNGGPTETMALPSGSPAVDAGNPNGCTDELGHVLKTDQRGKPRPDTEDTGGCDMGAYESQSD